MTTDPHIYDLMLLLSTSADEQRRAKILADVQSAISSGGGSLVRNDAWGRRSLSYEIDHQSDAEYHLLQFHGPPSLLDALTHNLKIADGVLRFRLIRVLPGTPPAPDQPAAPVPTPAPAPAPPAAGPPAAVPTTAAVPTATTAAVPTATTAAVPTATTASAPGAERGR